MAEGKKAFDSPDDLGEYKGIFLNGGTGLIQPSGMHPALAGKPKFSGGGLSGLMADKTRLATYMGILMPNVFVAPIRYFTMRETPDVRYRLFMRDVLAAAAGVASFYATRFAVRPILSKTLMKAKSAENIELAATFTAWVVNVLVQGIGAVRMSEWMSKRQQAREKIALPAPVAAMPVVPPRPALPVRSAVAAPMPAFLPSAFPVSPPAFSPARPNPFVTGF